jgi:hypothetical protein
LVVVASWRWCAPKWSMGRNWGRIFFKQKTRLRNPVVCLVRARASLLINPRRGRHFFNSPGHPSPPDWGACACVPPADGTASSWCELSAPKAAPSSHHFRPRRELVSRVCGVAGADLRRARRLGPARRAHRHGGAFSRSVRSMFEASTLARFLCNASAALGHAQPVSSGELARLSRVGQSQGRRSKPSRVEWSSHSGKHAAVLVAIDEGLLRRLTHTLTVMNGVAKRLVVAPR